MIRLINQFDNKKSKLSLATPTCGCCCCCCCCLISTVAVSSISARNFGKFIAQGDKEQEIKKRYPVLPMVFGFFAPAAAAILGLVVYLLFIGEFYNTTESFPWIIGSLGYLIIMFSALKKHNKLGGLIGRTIGFAILLAIAVVGEAIGAIWAIDAGLGYVYLIGAIIIDILLFINMCKSKDKNNYTESNNVVKNQNIESDTIQNNDNENTTLEETLNEQVVQKEETPKPKKKCTKCGADNGEDTKFCFICTAPFDNGDDN